MKRDGGRGGGPPRGLPPSHSPRDARRPEVTYTADMDSASRRTADGWSGRPGIAVLLAVALALAFISAGQPVHLHHGTTAGVYNEAHVLAALDSVTGDVPLPADSGGVRLDVAVATAQLPPDERSTSSAVRLSDSRAPPLA